MGGGLCGAEDGSECCAGSGDNTWLDTSWLIGALRPPWLQKQGAKPSVRS